MSVLVDGSNCIREVTDISLGDRSVEVESLLRHSVIAQFGFAKRTVETEEESLQIYRV